MVSDPLDPPVPPARHPYQVWAMVACVISGAGLLITGPAENSLVLLLPDWGRIAWAGGLLAGGSLCLAGAWWRDAASGLILERAGQVGLCGCTLAYGAAVVSVAIGNDGLVRGLSRAAVAALLTIGIGLAAGQRARQISRALRRLQHMRPGPTSTDPGGGHE